MTLPAILASGIVPTKDLQREPELQLAATLQKPFTVHELVDTVDDVLRAVDGDRSRS